MTRQRAGWHSIALAAAWWSWGSFSARRPATGRPLFMVDLIDALTADGRVRLEGPARMLAPVVLAGGAGAVEADPGAPPGQDAHSLTVTNRRRRFGLRHEICQAVVPRVAWTLADLGGRSAPGADEVAEALGMRLQRVAA